MRKILFLIFLCPLCFSAAWAQDYSPGSNYSTPRTYIFPAKSHTSKGMVQQDVLTDMVNQGFEYIYNFEFEKADSIIYKIKKAFPAQSITYLLTANYYWWQLISGEDNELNRLKFRQSLDLANSLIGDKLFDSLSNDEIFVLINSYSFKSRLELKEKHYIKAVMGLNDCVSYLQFSFGKEDTYEPYRLTSGLYNYFYEYGIDNYPILYPSLIFYPKGNKVKGLELLEKATRSKQMLVSNEGYYFLLKIYLEMEKNAEKAQDYAKILVKRHPANLVYQYLYFKSLIQSNDFANARKQLEIINKAALTNSKLTPSQKTNFLDLAKEDLKNYFARNQ